MKFNKKTKKKKRRTTSMGRTHVVTCARSMLPTAVWHADVSRAAGYLLKRGNGAERERERE